MLALISDSRAGYALIEGTNSAVVMTDCDRSSVDGECADAAACCAWTADVAASGLSDVAECVAEAPDV